MADNPILQAALSYADAGYRVFPCHPKTKAPLLKAAARGAGGLKLASTQAARIRQWWQTWPKAMIGMPTGEGVGWVIDLDLGEPQLISAAAYLDRLIAWVKAEGGAMPGDVPIVETGSGGYHLWFAWTPAHPVGNRGNLIKTLAIAQPDGAPEDAKVAHIDVRGAGGYVIVPPSKRADGRGYTWVQGDLEHGLPSAPDALLLLAAKRRREDKKPVSTDKPRTGQAKSQNTKTDAERRYALAALDEECARVAAAAPGTRNETLNEATFLLGQLVGAGALTEHAVFGALASIVGQWENVEKSEDTIKRALDEGAAQPRDLSHVEAKKAPKRRAGGRAAKGPKAALPEPAAEPPRQLEMREILRESRKRADPPPIEKRGGVGPGRWTPDVLGLPCEDPCPVIPLGINGRKYHFLDSAGQDAALLASAFNQAGIQDLFAATPHWPEWACPRWGEKKVADPVTGKIEKIGAVASHQGDDVRKMLFRACVRKGHFDPEHRIRGRGGWRRADGALLYHAGEELWFVEGGRIRAIDTGVIEDGGEELIFPRRPSLPPPWPHPIEPKDNPARALLEGFGRWNWDRPDVAPVLLLGWIATAFLGGAPDWRSQVFLIGDFQTGKSTLQRAIKDIFGDALLESANASAAFVYQTLLHDTRPVALDEFEGKADNRRAEAMVELARQGSSGATGGRGGAEGSAHSFTIRSPFLFSCINNPPLLPQDLSRNAILRLRELPKDLVDEKGERRDKPITINVETCGRMCLARMMSEWHRFDATLAAYKDALRDGGHTGRGQDTYGHLLAAADLLIGPELADELGLPMVDDLKPWAELLHVDTLPEVGDATANWRACINHMLQSRVEVWRSGERATVGQLLEDFFAGDLESDKYVRKQLAQAGLGFVFDRTGTGGGGRGWCLTVPSQSPLLARLFYGSRWQGAPGAGGWSEALRQAPREVVWSGRDAPRPRINGVQERAPSIVLKEIGLQPTT